VLELLKPTKSKPLLTLLNIKSNPRKKSPDSMLMLPKDQLILKNSLLISKLPRMLKKLPGNSPDNLTKLLLMLKTPLLLLVNSMNKKKTEELVNSKT